MHAGQVNSKNTVCVKPWEIVFRLNRAKKLANLKFLSKAKMKSISNGGLTVVMAVMLSLASQASIAGGYWGAAITGALEAAGEDARRRMEQERQLELIREEYRLKEAYRLQQEEREHQRQIAAKEEERKNGSSTGTGFFIAPNGYLVTNAHVIDEYENISIRTQNRRLLTATVIAIDKERDLALLKVEGKYTPLRVDQTGRVSKGQRVMAIGYPQPTIQGSESKVTDGVISSFTGLRNDDNWFQISVPIQGGNSGGPLINENGDVIGVVVATVNAQKFLSITGNIPQNVNYAIKSKVLLEFLAEQQIRNSGNNNKKTSIDAVDRSTVLIIAKHGVSSEASDNPSAQAPLPAPRVNKKAEDAKLTRMHPNWRKIIQSDSFKKWLKETNGAEASFDTNIASERARILSNFSTYIEEQKRAALAANELIKLAEQGNAEAQHKLGNKFDQGDGMSKDSVKACEWWLKAAVQGYAKSQYSLGFAYKIGDGVRADLVLAYAWFALSAEQGHESAKVTRDYVDKRLTPTQRTEGQQLISNWKKGDNLLRSELPGAVTNDTPPSNSSTSTSTSTTEKSDQVNASGKVIFFRKSNFVEAMATIKAMVSVDDKLVGAVAQGTYVISEVFVGTRQIVGIAKHWAYGSMAAPCQHELHVAAGQQYFFRIDNLGKVERNSGMANCSFVSVQEAEALEEISRLKKLN